MANPLKATGEIVRTLSGTADMDLAGAKKMLFEALTSGSTDPVDYIQAIGEALMKMEAAHNAAKEINWICEKAAVRGAYKRTGKQQ